MSEPAPIPAPPAVADPTPYRPVSGLAIAGLILSGLFAAWVLSATLVAFRTGTPFLMDPVSLLLPLAGFVFSLGARIQIRRSEGTRAGLPLATWGMWLSIFFGLGYGAYRGATEYALRLQAKEFTNNWFELMRGDDVDAHAAFWDTLDPSLRDQRANLDNPEQRQQFKNNAAQWDRVQKDISKRFTWGEGKGGLPERGPLARFFTNDLIETIRQAGKDAQVEAQGIRKWEHVGGSVPGYRVEQDYRIATPDGDLDVAVALLGTDDQNTGRRQWRVLLDETGIRERKWTPRGQACLVLRSSSQRFAAGWAKRLAQGQLSDAYLDSCLPPEREALRLAFLLVNPALLPGYAEFAQGRLLHAQGLVMPDPKRRAELLAEARGLFETGRDGRFAIQVAEVRPSSRYELESGGKELRFLHIFEARFGDDFRCGGTLLVATRSPAALAAVNGDGPASLRLAGEGRNVTWWIADMKLEWAVALSKK